MDLADLQRSVERLREQRVLVERVQSESASKDEELKTFRRNESLLKQKLANVGLEALEREKKLRMSLVDLEKQLSRHRQTEEQALLETKTMSAQHRTSEAAMKEEICRLIADMEDREVACEKEVDNSRQMVSDMLARVNDAETRAENLERQFQRKASDFEKYKKQTNHQIHMLQKEINETETYSEQMKIEMTQNREKVLVLQMLLSQKDNLIAQNEENLISAQDGELLLQRTVHEMQETLLLLREQLDLAQTGSEAWQSKLTSAELRAEKAERDVAELELGKEIKNIMKHEQKENRKPQCNQCANHKKGQNEANQKMHSQLKTLSQKIKDLQLQLMDEMRINQGLNKKIEEERKERESAAEQRVKILTDFYDEETKLQQTLSELKKSTRYANSSSDSSQDILDNNVAKKTTASSRAKKINKKRA